MSPHIWSVTASDSALWLCRNEFRHTVHVSVANWAACLCSFHRNTHLQRGVCVCCACDSATSTQPSCGVHAWHSMRAEHKQPWCVRGLRSAVEIHPGRRRELLTRSVRCTQLSCCTLPCPGRAEVFPRMGAREEEPCLPSWPAVWQWSWVVLFTFLDLFHPMTGASHSWNWIVLGVRRSKGEKFTCAECFSHCPYSVAAVPAL